ncbi:HBL/NHE enterotoxin family protein [Bacillus mycoides]|uniref:HBL/NHE enterotoxin family protein n=1 Tax=Bacillus mycoides TaxID=1405 RepID=UPI0038050E6D
MKKTFYKTILLPALILTITVTHMTPEQVFATEEPIKQNITKQFASNFKYSLGPENIQSAVSNMPTGIFLIESYAQIIIEQPDIEFLTITDNALNMNIINSQHIARNNAQYWINTIKPQLIKTNQNIINYNTIFQKHYSTLIDAVNNKNDGLENTLQQLYSSIIENKEETNSLIATLVQFKNKMAMDMQNFKTASQKVTTILTTQDALIPQFEKQITAYTDAINGHNNRILAGTILCGFGILAIVGGVMIITAVNEITAANEKIRNLTDSISSTKKDMTVLTVVKSQITYLTTIIDMALDSLKMLSNKWYNIESKYQSLLLNISNIDSEDQDFLRSDIETARDSWQSLKNVVEKNINILMHSDEKLTGFQNIDNIFYYFDDGKVQTGWKEIHGKLYYFGKEGDTERLKIGEKASGWKEIHGKTYYFGKKDDGTGLGEGQMANNWFKIGENWYAAESNGEMANGWKKWSGINYYFGKSGDGTRLAEFEMATGFQTIDGYTYYFGKKDDGTGLGEGQMATGWFQVGNDWYNASSGGDINLGTTNWGSDKYFFDKTTGKSLFFIRKSGDKYYRYDSGGSNATLLQGFQIFNGKAYYFSKDIDKLYNFDLDPMARDGRYDLDGKSYQFNATGELINNWLEIEGKWYYFDLNGEAVSG